MLQVRRPTKKSAKDKISSMVKIVSLLGRKKRSLPTARTQLRFRRFRSWTFLGGIATVMVVGALLVAAPAEKYSVILLPTEEGPKKVSVPASGEFILGKPQVSALLIEGTSKRLLFKSYTLPLSDEVLLCQEFSTC